MRRLGLAVMAFAFPLLLWIGGYYLGHLSLPGSMSAYYHATPLTLSIPIRESPAKVR